MGTVSEKYGGERTALHIAAADLNDIDQVRKWLSRGVDVNISTSAKLTPLLAVAMCNEGDSHYEVAKLLLEKGADVNARYYGASTLSYLVMEANVKMLELFISHGASQQLDQEDTDILLEAAAYNRNFEVLQYLVNIYGLDVNNRSMRSRLTPLHYACAMGYCYNKNVKWLLKNGADINAVDARGETPLFGAMRNFAYKIRHITSFSDKMVEYNFTFMLEHACVNTNNLDDKNFSRIEIVPRKIVLIFLKHLAKLQALGIPAHPSLLKTISEKVEYRDYFKSCQEELLEAKSVKLENSWVTFYNLLVDSRRKLKNYAGNGDLINDFNKSDRLENLFPIYGACMEKNVKKGFKRRKLFDKSAVVLSRYLPIFDSFHLIVRDTLDCIMSKKDLSKFCMIKVES